MIKKLSLLLFVVVLVASCSSPSVLERHLEASGMNKVKDIKSLEMELDMQVMGMAIPMKITSVGDSKVRVEVSMMGQNVISVMNGENSWVSQNGTVSDVSMDDVKEQIKTSNPTDMFSFYTEEGAKVTEDGKEKIDGKETYKMKVIKADGTETFINIDAETFLLSKFKFATSMMGQDVNAEVFPKEYKDYAGIQFPTKMVMKMKDVGEIIMVYKSIKINEPVDDSLFEKP